MPTTIPTTIQASFDAADVKRLAGARGTCVSFLLPDQIPGTSTINHHALLHRLIKDAHMALGDAGELLEPVTAIADDDRLNESGPGLAFFCSSSGVQGFRVKGINAASLAIGSHFQLAPLVSMLGTPRDFFILGLSKQHTRLWHYEADHVREAEWPADVPFSLDQADHGHGEDAHHQSATRPDREGAGHLMAHFFQRVDHGLAHTLAGKPLLLGGVADEVAAYRKLSKHQPIMTAELTGSIEHKRKGELAALARDIATESYCTAAAETLAACLATKDPHKKLDDIKAILQAASEGRVHKLCVRDGAVVNGPMPAELDQAKRETEDLVTAAVGETLRTGGDVYVVRAEDMPDQVAVAALRY